MSSGETDSSDSDIFDPHVGSSECRGEIVPGNSQELIFSQVDSQSQIALLDAEKPVATSSSSENTVTGGKYKKAYFGSVNQPKQSTRIDKRKQSFHYHVASSGEPSISGTQLPQKKRKADKLNLPQTGITVFTSKLIYKSTSGICIYEGEKNKAGGVHEIAVKFCAHSERAMREAKSLEAIRYHPNVVGIHDTGIHTTELGDNIFIAMERCSVENLFNFVSESDNFDPQQAMEHSLQIIRGLKYIHSRKIYHRDLKPHNILFLAGPTYNQIKIADFGFSKSSITDPHPTSQGFGTMGYTAPEVINGEARKDHTKCDIFSLGILLHFRLSNGRHPYGIKNVEQMLNIQQGNDPDLRDIRLPNGAQRRAVQRIIREMLQNDPEHRPTTTMILKKWREDVGDQAIPAASGPGGFDEPNYERIASPCIIGASPDDELLYWPSIQELRYDSRVISEMPKGSGHFTLIAVGRRLYMLKEKIVCYELDLDNVATGWNRLASMKHDHGSSPPAAVLNEKLYVCGSQSWSIEAATNKCEVFTRRTGQWSDIAEMNEARNKHCVVSEGESLYSIGGLDGERKAMSSVEKYILTDNTWVTIQSLNVARYRPQAVVYNEKIYVAGGYSSLGQWIPSFECFDPATSNWTLLNSAWLDRNRPNFLFVFDNRVLSMLWTGPTDFRTVCQVPLDNEQQQDEADLVRVELPRRVKLNRIIKVG